MGIWRDKKSGKWKYSFQKAGKTYGGGGFATKREAIAEREARRLEILKPAANVTGYRLREWAVAYLEYSERRFAPKTFDSKRRAIRRLLSHLGDIAVDAVTPHMIEGFLSTMPTNAGWNVYRKELAVMWEYGRTVLQINTPNPVKAVSKLPHTPPKKRIPTEAEILRLIAAVSGNDRALLLVILNTLARVGEIFRLRWEDVNFDERVVTLYTRKRRGGSYEADVMPMNDTLFAVLNDLWQHREQNEWVFINPKTGQPFERRKDYMNTLCKHAGIDPPFGFHALRHFMASFLADKKKRSTKTIQKLLRHQNINTTDIYLHSLADGVREAMNEAGELFQDQKLVADLVADLRPVADKTG